MIDCRRPRLLLSLTLLSAGLAIAVGCTPAAAPPSTAETQQEAKRTIPSLSAEEILAKMVETYSSADTYVDQATYYWSRAKRGEGIIRQEVTHELSLAVARPSQLRFRSDQVLSTSANKVSFDVAADGQVIRSSTGDVEDQIHEVPAPETLTPENFIPDPNMRAAALEVGLDNIYPQLTIMLTDAGIKEAFPKAESFEVIENEKVHGRDCHRVVLSSSDGKRMLWIDAETFVLLRMDLPIESQMPQLDPDDVFSRYAIWIDYNQPSLGAEIDPGVFAKKIPEAGRRVRKLVPPPPVGPDESLGKPVGAFSFTTLDEQEITPQSVEGKVVILDFWLNSCPPCKRHTPILEEVYQKFKDNDRFVFYAVNANLPKHNLSNETIQNLFTNWGGTFPVLRDLKETSDFQMGIRRYPHIVVLDPDGDVQFDEGGEHTDAQPLIDLVQKLLDGGDPAADAVAKHQKLRDKFQSDLEEVTIE